MSLRSDFRKKVFHFNFDARTSRGRMKDKTSWFIRLWNDQQPDIVGIGECGPLPGLSKDDVPDFETVLQSVLQSLPAELPPAAELNAVVNAVVPPGFSSIRFGLEVAMLDLIHGAQRKIVDSPFSSGQRIPINGLVWMGDLDYMLQQSTIKIEEGYSCIKIKVGGLNFEKECDILHYIRRKYFRNNITLRLDANGAFKLDDVLFKLTELAKFDIHSIEQPIKPGLPEMEELCRKSPIPIAFDEELIGVEAREEKEALLNRLKPQYIVLKPTLHGGLASCREWIALAEARNIGWWLTSALESNIGLNAICQFAAAYPLTIPQGLGTGKLYDDNIPSPLSVKNGEIFSDLSAVWDVSDL